MGTAWVLLCYRGSRADGLLQQAQLIAVLLLGWLYSPVMYFGTVDFMYVTHHFCQYLSPVHGDTIMLREGNGDRESPGCFGFFFPFFEE